MRLIDADKLKTSLNETVDAAIKWHEDCLGEIMQNRSEAAITAFIECILRLKEQPTVDAVEVVRCKDCRHFEADIMANPWGVCCHDGWVDGHSGHEVSESGWCYRAERRPDGSN